MSRIPLPWNAGSDSASNENPASGAVPGRRDTLEANYLAWAKSHPILTLLAVYPCWVIFTSLAPAFALKSHDGSKSVRMATSGYKFTGRMARVALREFTNRRQTRSEN
jgi:hypothetical protein